MQASSGTDEDQWRLIQDYHNKPQFDPLTSRNRRPDYFTALVLLTIGFYIPYGIFSVGLSSGSKALPTLYWVLIDAITVIVAFTTYNLQIRNCLNAIKDFRRHIEIAGYKVETGREESAFLLWRWLIRLFWRGIVRRLPSWVNSARNTERRRGIVTVLFVLASFLIWLAITQVLQLPTRFDLVRGLLYTLYFAAITVLAISFSMTPPTEAHGITEQCWFVARSHIVYTIPFFYGMVGVWYFFVTNSQQSNSTALIFLSPLEEFVVIFSLGVAVVTILDTSITIWTLVRRTEVKSLNPLSTDHYGGMGRFYSIITWNSVSLGALALLQSSKLIVWQYLVPSYEIGNLPILIVAPTVGVPLLLLLTWLVSNYFIQTRIRSHKRDYLSSLYRTEDELTGRHLQGFTDEERQFFTSLGPEAQREILLGIRTWPTTNSLVATIVVAVVIQVLLRVLSLG